MRTKPDYREVLRVVRDIQSQLDLQDPPINPVTIARQLGLGVRFANFGGKFYRISGFYDPKEHSIWVNKEEDPRRQTFTIAHELGHALMHREWAASDDYEVLWRDQQGDPDDFREKEANAFAANLLVPRELLTRYYARLSVEELSQLFAVSVPVIKNRLAFEYGV